MFVSSPLLIMNSSIGCASSTHPSLQCLTYAEFLFAWRNWYAAWFSSVHSLQSTKYSRLSQLIVSLQKISLVPSFASRALCYNFGISSSHFPSGNDVPATTRGPPQHYAKFIKRDYIL
uniref:Uncharacterized protein n=1 Tax=Opuntia streptacantha TaxID=393608 RepID=A0A7C9E818_OPUST